MFSDNRIFFILVISAFLCAAFMLFNRHFSLLPIFMKQELPAEDLYSYTAWQETHGKKTDRAVVHGMFYSSDEGLILDANKKSYFALNLPAPGSSEVTVYVDAYPVDGGHPQLMLYIPGSNKEYIVSDRFWMRNIDYTITKYVSADSPFVLLLKNRNNQGIIVIHELRVRSVCPPHPFPKLDVLIVFLFFMLIFGKLLYGHYGKLPVVFGSHAVFVAVLFLGSLFDVHVLLSPWYWLYMLAACTVFRYVKTGIHEDVFSSFRNLDILLIAISVGIILRWGAFLSSLGQPLPIDPTLYRKLAHSLDILSPYSTSFREPFYIWVQYVGESIFGPNIHQFRFVSFIISCVTLIAVYFFSKQILRNEVTAVFAVFFMSINQYDIISSSQSERTVLYNLLAALICYMVLTLKRTSFMREALFAVLSAFLCLTWLVGIPCIVLLYAFHWIYHRVKLRYALSYAAIVCLMLFPQFWSQYKQNRDPLYSLNFTVDYYAHHIVERNILPEKTNSDPGSKMTSNNWALFMAKTVKIKQVFAETLMGYFNIFLNPFHRMTKSLLGFHYLTPYSYYMFVFYFVGLILEIVRKQWQIFALLFAFVNISPFFTDIVFIPRYLSFISLFFAYFWACGISYIICKTIGLMGRYKIS
jgi:hypothetical protein